MATWRVCTRWEKLEFWNLYIYVWSVYEMMKSGVLRYTCMYPLNQRITGWETLFYSDGLSVCLCWREHWDIYVSVLFTFKRRCRRRYMHACLSVFTMSLSSETLFCLNSWDNLYCPTGCLSLSLHLRVNLFRDIFVLHLAVY